MFALFNEEEFVTEKFGNVELENVKGEIEFKNVKYTFVEYEADETLNYSKMTPKELKALKKNKKERKIKSTNQIFSNLSFKIEPNTTVAFVGKSGSGKSTILNLMSKLYQVDDGAVTIDKVNINDLSKNTLRKTISLVNQFPYIFDMTIKENLLLAKKDATDEEIADAIKKASLEEFIASLNDGIDTKVGESGIKLSGGQKQRLAIARAMLRNSPIIIFDESTSSLDNFAQGEIKKSIDGLKGKSTIIIVAHRLSTIRNVDKIFFLDNGKIEDIGTFDELFENNVKFKNMFYAENLN
jgi:ATP-binding cassette subfamily B protein